MLRQVGQAAAVVQTDLGMSPTVRAADAPRECGAVRAQIRQIALGISHGDTGKSRIVGAGDLDKGTKFDLWGRQGSRRLATRKNCRPGVLCESRQRQSE